MKILILNDWGFKLGGAEAYFFLLAEGLKERGHEVVSVSSDRVRGEREISTDYQLRHTGNFFNLDSLFKLGNLFSLRKILSKEKPDLVFLNNIFYTLSPSILFALRDVPSLMTLHDYFIICAGDKRLLDGAVCRCAFSECLQGCRKKTGIRERVFRKIIRRGLTNVNKLIAPSSFVKTEFERNHYLNVEVKPHPIQEIAQVDDFLNNSKTFIYLGRLAEQKGLQYLIRAFSKLLKVYPEARLKIAGLGPEEEKLKVLVRQLECESGVEFLGFVSGEEKEKLINDSLCLVYPSLWPEVSGLSILESAAFARISIVTNIGGMSDFVKNEETGLLVNPGNEAELKNAMERVLNERELVTNLAKNAYKAVKERELSKYLDDIEIVFQTILNKR